MDNVDDAKPRHKQLYRCPRCGHTSKQIGHYRTHISKKHMCEPSLADVLPTVNNAHIVSSNAPYRTIGNNNMIHTVLNNVTTNNNNNSININLVHSPSSSSQFGKKLMRFPYQNLDHVSNDFKRAVVDMASKADGFVKAVHKMFQVTYFDPSQPHNMNIIISDANTDVAHVFESNDMWKAMHADAAIKEMLDTQGDAIRNFPDDPGLDGTIHPSHIHAIDTTYGTASYIEDTDLMTAVRHMAIESNDNMSRVLDPFHQLAIGMTNAKTQSTSESRGDNEIVA